MTGRTTAGSSPCFLEVGKVLSSDGYADARFSLLWGEQRAIGELMVADGGESCIGYAEFCRRICTDSAFAAWFDRPSDDIEEPTTRTTPAGGWSISGIRCWN
ncbi:hypothetical protein ACFC5Z_17155 [Streptomyces sp. NPDC056004]|uniref:hypothetical protein n=1 Tax=Streptomyces sp. NPDC056004 TaxID=3345677 RepID=UPI0035D5FFDD